MTEPRFLVVRLGSLGDIVHTFPAVAALRASYPAPKLSGSPTRAGRISSPAARWLTKSGPWIPATSLTSAPSWRKFAQNPGKPRSTTRGSGNPRSYLSSAAFANALAFLPPPSANSAFPFFIPTASDPKTIHIADQNGELSLRAGAAQTVSSITLQVKDADRQRVCADLASAGIDRYIVLSPGGGWRSKCWPADRFGALCQKIREHLNLRCVINYGPGEEELAAAVKTASGNAAPIAYDGELGQLMALLRGTQCIVGGDTGPLHLAIALGTRAVAIFGPTNPARNGPYPPQPFVLRDPAAATTHDRDSQTSPSLLKISVEQVFDAVQQRLAVRS